MKNISINTKNSTIELTSKKFATAASKFGTDEYKLLQEARRDYPGFKVVVVARKTTKSSYKGLTYKYMEDYIAKHDDENNTINLREFEEMRLISKCHSKAFRYPVIKSWFLQKYPEIAKFGVCGAPKTEENGEAPIAIPA